MDKWWKKTKNIDLKSLNVNLETPNTCLLNIICIMSVFLHFQSDFMT